MPEPLTEATGRLPAGAPADTAAREAVLRAAGLPVVDLAAVIAVAAAGGELRASTADWFARNALRLSLDRSLDLVSATYRAHW